MSVSKGAVDTARRLQACDDGALASVVARGLTPTEAARVFARYKRERVIKRDLTNATWSVKHGAYWELDVLKRACGPSAKESP